MEIVIIPLFIYRMQMRKTSSAHKKNSCKFHDLSNCKEGALINSMDQVNNVNIRGKSDITFDTGPHNDGVMI